MFRKKVPSKRGANFKTKPNPIKKPKVSRPIGGPRHRGIRRTAGEGQGFVEHQRRKNIGSKWCSASRSKQNGVRLRGLDNLCPPQKKSMNINISLDHVIERRIFVFVLHACRSSNVKQRMGVFEVEERRN